MMKLAFILDHALMHYRIPFFNRLVTETNYQITVYHSGKLIVNSDLLFKQVITRNKTLFKVLDFRQDIVGLAEFDVIICMQNIRLLNLWQLSLSFNRSYKLIHWGIGTSSAKGLGSESYFVKKLRSFLMRFADAVVFYSSYPLKTLSKNHKTKSFVALNTIDNRMMQDMSSFDKDSFLFIGSLNKRKGLRELIAVFHEYLTLNPSNIKTLLIIGEGEEGEYISNYIIENQLHSHIKLFGKIEDSEKKTSLFRRSIASISLDQAGLSVLESFSFGVPFIAKEDAISGGEHLNVENFKTGFLVKNKDDLIEKLRWMDENYTKDAIKLGENAFKFYSDKANMDLMVNSFVKAIQYAKEN